MSISSILKKALKAGYYVVTYEDMQYARTEIEALRLVDSIDKMGRDSAVYSYRDGVFRRCLVVDLEKLFTEQQKEKLIVYPVL